MNEQVLVGKMSECFKIENSFYVLEVNTLGAEMKSIFVKKWQRELLWVPKDEKLKKVWSRTAPVLFPIVGKLKNDSYRLIDKIYQMTQHGFARDLNFKCLSINACEMEFFLEADQETFKLYPFCFELRVKYVLVDHKLNITYDVRNVDRQDIYFSIGAHPAFVTDHLEDYEIRFEQREAGFFQLKNGLVNWEELKPLESVTLKPNPELFSKDALIFKNLRSKYIDLVNRANDEVIRVSGTDTPFLGIWAKDLAPFICIEPWYGVSDDSNHDQNLKTKNGIQTLEMGKSFSFSYSIETRFLETLS